MGLLTSRRLIRNTNRGFARATRPGRAVIIKNTFEQTLGCQLTGLDDQLSVGTMILSRDEILTG